MQKRGLIHVRLDQICIVTPPPVPVMLVSEFVLNVPGHCEAALGEAKYKTSQTVRKESHPRKI